MQFSFFSLHGISNSSAWITIFFIIKSFKNIWNIFFYWKKKIDYKIVFWKNFFKVSKMTIILKTFSQNTNGWRDWNKAADMLRVLLSFSRHVPAIEETPFVVTTMLRCYLATWLIYKAYGYRQARCVSLLVNPTLGLSVDLVHTDALGRLNMASIDVKIISFPIIAWAERTKGVSFFLLKGYSLWIRLN